MKTSNKNTSTVENFKALLKACQTATNLESLAQQEVAKTYISDHNAFANYINSLERIGDFKAKVKAFQYILGKQATQRLAFEIKDEKQKPTHKLKFKTANKTLLAQGLCSIQQLEAKAYIWILQELKPTIEKSFEEELEALMKKHEVQGEFIKA
jgi:ABC-type transport system involved in cytochrome c biogenesis ATPase subunit